MAVQGNESHCKPNECLAMQNIKKKTQPFIREWFNYSECKTDNLKE